MSYPELGLLIDGQWHRASATTLPVLNPADETVLGALPVATSTHIAAAVAAAARGFALWQDFSPGARAQGITRAASLLRARLEPIALASTLEQGKPLQQSRAELLRACDIIEWDANEGRRL